MRDATTVWAIHGQQYDLQPWMHDHPGGSYVLRVTRGSDCTALFETSHPLCKARALARLRAFRCDDDSASGRGDDWALYDELCAVLRSYAHLHGTKATDSPRAMAWYAVWIAVYLVTLARWAADPTAANCAVLAAALWYCAADLLHSGTHGALTHSPMVGAALGAALGAVFCAPAAWMRQHVLGHHAAINRYGVDPDIRHHAQRTHGWRTCVAQRWHAPYRHWRRLLPVNAMLTQLVPAVGHTTKMLLHGRYPGARAAVAWAPGEREASAVALLCVAAGGALHARAHGAVPAAAPFLACGAAYYLFSQVSHINAPSFAPPPRGAAGGWAAEQVAGCAGDYSTGSVAAGLVSIGLNNQGMHHLFPTVHHVHYAALDGPVSAALARHGVRRDERRQTYWQSLAAHIRHLAQLNDRDGGGAAQRSEPCRIPQQRGNRGTPPSVTS